MPHVFMVWGCCWEIKWQGQWNTRIRGPMYISSSVAKLGNVLPNLWMFRVKGYFYILWKIWQQFSLRKHLDKKLRPGWRCSNPETALKLSRNIGKENQCDSNNLFDEEEGTRTSWDLWSPLEYRSPRRGMTQLGSDGVAEPVYKLDYLRLGCPTHFVSYERRT